ncbi:FMN-binding protein [Wukongibacter baidiensis]|uniref:FMN-binding protein n=1 Tax=Wukongibacter baidiensis TaxID=1723361 RepID=UPI003D7F479C
METKLNRIKSNESKGFKIKKITSLFALISLIALYGIYMYDTHRTDDGIVEFLESYTAYDSYEKINSTPLTYKALNADSEVGYLIFGEEVGYQSNIKIATLIDLKGKIINVKTYSHNETPAFYERLITKGFFKQFDGMSIENGFKIGTNVDAITSSTISSNAITKAVHEGGSYVASEYLGLETKNLYNKIKVGSAEIAVTIMLALVAIAYKTKNKRLRTLVLLYSIIILGFKFAMFITYSFFFSVATGKMPAIAEDLKRYLLFFGSFALILGTGKNLYCSYICPYGAIQELEYRFAKLRFLKISPKVKKALSVLPGFIAYLALVLALTTKEIGILSYEPFSLLYGRIGNGIQWLLLPVTLFMGLVVMRFYCNFGCPVGFTINSILKVRLKVVNLWKRK